MSQQTNKYFIGAAPTLLGVFRDEAGGLIDPTTVSLKVKKPDGTPLVFTYPADVVKQSTGRYTVKVQTDQAGRWYYRWEATGQGQGADERDFEVKASNV